MQTASVYLVGAGPGDPELLTVKARRLLDEAEVVVYDRLVSPEIMALVARGTARISVGKQPGNHPIPQDEIHRLLVALARSGRKVVRLKGGDPYTFGRGSEEAAFLAAEGIRFEVVPGITSASGCAAAIGVPLTHRGLASGLRYVTGHCRGDQKLELDWRGLADPDTTLVLYMATVATAHICQIAVRLIAEGLPESTPAAAIANGTRPNQEVMITTLGEIAEAAMAFEGPLLFLIGKVVGLAQVLSAAGQGAKEAEPALGADLA
ncbi:MAG: uroporphyrinogen-III C-methyltransferase [Alphaproteobacteria bacterium]